ncbi:ATP-dependent RecD-like DNA helicase [Floricoccus penangensis]|uniref:SF1B family DNA helicase RecD2 n=1 Tax=Floricoccus penangensis TaxID=1859475 RepID=UPI002041501C|nr:ATP-dependent RecD-like DNA helicase [Floricoccus penangensis]URZ86873.1 ATP-dependent RecD-like DNA helicase [Floricoccus penangensis]
MDEKTFFTGNIEAVFFENPSNFYKVLLIDITDTNSDYLGTEIVVNGIIGDVIEGEAYTFFGQMTNHPKYGEQLKVDTYEKAVPSSGSGLIKYLSSDHFPGIGKKTAEKIVDAYPDDTIDAILEDHGKLNSILSPTKKSGFLKLLSQNHGMEKILSKLSEYGMPSKINFQIYDLYKQDTLDIIAENPYQLVEDIKGIGFKTADKIAADQGIEPTSNERYRAAIMHLVPTMSLATGDTYIEAKELLEYTVDLLEKSRNVEIPYDDVALAIGDLIDEGKIQQEGTKIFDNSLFFAESGIARNIQKLMLRKSDSFSKEEVTSVIKEAEEDFDIEYDNLQKKAIEEALNNQLFILTGGPGTGKTTVLNGIIQSYARLNDINLDPTSYHDDVFPILLAAPTGRAARRMNELTGLPSATLHRHLGIGTDDDISTDLTDELSGSLLIVDEFSMVDTWLAHRLFESIPPSMKVIIVGDADQLPSVGPGQILADLLKVEAIPSITLDKIFRQGKNSTITDLAHSIKDGELPEDFTSRQPDRSYFEVGAGQVPNIIEQIATSWKKKGNNPFELQVLIPMYKGVAGINNVNKLVQDIFNPLRDGLEFNFQEISYRRGDKVLHLVNETSLNVFNGDLGFITDLVAAKYTESKQDEIVMDFDGAEVIYPRSEWYKITLAYAMSIHKSQGSEFSTVVVPMVSSYSRMLERNLLYTGITRAKKSLILLGEYNAYNQAVHKIGSNRKTYLLEQFGIERDSDIESSSVAEDAKEHEVVENPQKVDSLSSDIESNVEEIAQEVDYQPKILTKVLVDNYGVDPMIGLKESDLLIFKR